MLDDTATSSAVTSSRDACNDDVIIGTNDVTDDAAVAAVAHSSEMVIGVEEHDLDIATEYVDVSSTSSVTSHGAAGTDAAVLIVDTSRTRPRSECRVCGDDAAGMYFGALVCVPCKVCPAQYVRQH